MASKDYDDLLESFMNNSEKVYREDNNNHNEVSNSVPSSYNNVGSAPVRRKKKGRQIEKELKRKNNASSRRRTQKQYNSPAGAFFAKLGKVLIGALMVVAVVGIVCLSVITIYGYSVVHGDPVFDLTEEKYSQNQTSFIYGYDSNGKTKEIARLHGEENRIWVDMDDMSPYMKKAFVALEDKRFEKHHGVDWFRTVSAIVVYRGEQGGSTITQQLIKNLTGENQVTFVRKFNEILSALNLERHYDKEEIIEAYLNTVYLSNGCYGVKTAAETYFGKDVSDLNAAECASIAAITQWPNKFDPLNNPNDNDKRKKICLKNMYHQKLITKDEYEQAINYKMVYTNSEDYKGSQVTKQEKQSNENIIESYYVDHVVESVISDLQKMGYSKRTARKMLYGGGLKVYTAVDFEIQKQLEDIYENYENMPDKKVQGACVVMDYEGRIVALVGGTGKKNLALGLNRATQSKRQPGSTIKPLSVYSAALQKSHDDDNTQIYWSTKISDSPLKKVDGKWWPTNSGSYSGNSVTLQYGLCHSLNTISARTLDMIGVDYSYDFITERYHISTLDSVNDCDYAPLATGGVTNGVTVLEMTAAFAAFGNGGYYYEPYAYYKVENMQGEVIIEKKPETTRERAISEGTAGVMNKILQTVMQNGTGSQFRLNSIQTFGKTGTTTDNKDRWFIGGTPDYVAGVWYGYDYPKQIVYYKSSNPCGTIWNSLMKKIYTSDNAPEKKEFDTPDTLVQKSYCTSTGQLAGSGCSKATGWFDSENLPSYCSGGHYYEYEEENSKSEKTTKKKKSTSSGETSAAATQPETQAATSADVSQPVQ